MRTFNIKPLTLRQAQMAALRNVLKRHEEEPKATELVFALPEKDFIHQVRGEIWILEDALKFMEDVPNFKCGHCQKLHDTEFMYFYHKLDPFMRDFLFANKPMDDDDFIVNSLVDRPSLYKSYEGLN